MTVTIGKPQTITEQSFEWSAFCFTIKLPDCWTVELSPRDVKKLMEITEESVGSLSDGMYHFWPEKDLIEFENGDRTGSERICYNWSEFVKSLKMAGWV